MSQFTGRCIPITVALPEDMIEYLRLRKYKDRITISKQVRYALNKDIMDRAELRLVDSRVEYVTGEEE